ncbi:MAG: nucleotidyltransferase family protein [bacterium]|nr:nucleotidyltransferase family protein [bacterium]
MSNLLLDEKIVAIAAALDTVAIDHAFGGAIALAYYGTPRGTTDIDLNVFVTTDYVYALDKVFSKLGAEKIDRDALSTLDREGHLRARWGHTPIDVFFAYDDFHHSCEERARQVPFAGTDISILSPEDLIVFKVVYGRPKDFRDIREVLLCMGEELDVKYMSAWLDRFLEPTDERMVKFREALEPCGSSR